jgi:hypothetical protein
VEDCLGILVVGIVLKIKGPPLIKRVEDLSFHLGNSYTVDKCTTSSSSAFVIHTPLKIKNMPIPNNKIKSKISKMKTPKIIHPATFRSVTMR